MWGVAGALVFKVIFALFATYLFEFYYIKILGGLLLIWIANDLRKDLVEMKNKIKYYSISQKILNYITKIKP